MEKNTLMKKPCTRKTRDQSIASRLPQGVPWGFSPDFGKEVRVVIEKVLSRAQFNIKALSQQQTYIFCDEGIYSVLVDKREVL